MRCSDLMAVTSASLSPASPETQALLDALQRADSALALLQATQALAACADPAIAPALVEVLGFNNPGAAVAAVDGLISLGEVAVPALLLLDPENYGARAWAVRALAGIGDVRGLELLEDALGGDVAASVRRAAAKGLGQLRLGGLDPERRSQTHQRCLKALLDACGDGEWVVRYAVVVGLESLAQPLPGDAPSKLEALRSLQGLAAPAHDSVPVVRLRAELALRRLAG